MVIYFFILVIKLNVLSYLLDFCSYVFIYVRDFGGEVGVFLIRWLIEVFRERDIVRVFGEKIVDVVIKCFGVGLVLGCRVFVGF